MTGRFACDGWLLVITLLLVTAGLFMVGSASNYFALASGLEPSAFWWKHGLHVVLGFGCLIATLAFPYRSLARPGVLGALVGGCLLALALVLAMPEIGGARRWYVLGPFTAQPSEAAKLVTIVFMAYVLSRKEQRVNDPWVLLPCLGVVAAFGRLIAAEPDLGSCVLLAASALVMLFAAGLRWRYLGAVAGAGALACGASILASPYQLKRILSVVDPSAEPLGSAFQLNQSLLAFGSGGLTGTGLGLGTQKAHYLYGAHTDFIYSVVGEELGLVGSGLLLLLFLLLFWRGIRIVRRAHDRFGYYLALGLTHLLVLQALINMGVCVGVLPTKGLPLPFVSYGGSSLMASMTAMGLLLNVSKPVVD